MEIDGFLISGAHSDKDRESFAAPRALQSCGKAYPPGENTSI
jgi:hypothetical protein